MNFHSPRPDRSPEAVAKRQKAADQARALNRHQGYRHDALLEDAKSRWVAGEITSEEMRAEMQAARGKR